MKHPKELDYRIYLIGFMGSGKSFYGVRLAKALDYQFLDTDEEIEKRTGKRIAEIFAEQGEAAFRKLEHEILKETISQKRIVVATGGGMPCFFDNIELMKNGGVVIYLQAEAALLGSRLEKDNANRPLLAGKSGENLHNFIDAKLESRQAFYQKAHAIIHLKEDDKEVVEGIIRFLMLV